MSDLVTLMTSVASHDANKPGKGFGWLLFYGIYSPLAFGRSSLAVDRLLPHTQMSWIRIPDAVECWWLMMMDTTTTQWKCLHFFYFPKFSLITENSAKSTPSLSLSGLQWLHPAYLVSLACNPPCLHSLPLSPCCCQSFPLILPSRLKDLAQIPI